MTSSAADAFPRKPKTNPRSAQLAAGRYEQIMASSAAGRYRNEVLGIARAKGEEAERHEVYNYGDMLFQEAQMTRARREAWRRDQMRERRAAEAEDTTFRPKINPAPSGGSPGSDGRGAAEVRDANFVERLARRDEEMRQKHQALAQVIRANEAKDLTFRPQAGDVLGRG